MKLPQLSLSPVLSQWDLAADPRASAVLALFIDDPDHGVSLVFTRRAAEMRSHAGQVGFPGGRREIFDEHPTATALREAQEEISLSSEKVTILGGLPPLKSLDGKAVFPIVAMAPITLTELRPNPEEVAEIFVVPWSELTREKRRILNFNIFGKWRETPHYEALGHHVWGLTAWMLDRMEISLEIESG